jgi:hypothetical protein
VLNLDFYPAAARAGVPRCRFHDLRHLHASYLALTGVPLKVAQERLGHATVAIMASIYQHTLTGQGQDAARRVAARVFGHSRSGNEQEMSDGASSREGDERKVKQDTAERTG